MASAFASAGIRWVDDAAHPFRARDRFLQRIIADRRVDHPVADHEQRRAGRADLAGEG